MKHFIVFLSLLFSSMSFADTINLHWLNEDGSIYQNSTCTVDGDLIIPSTPPTKTGYIFAGWKIEGFIPIEYIESTGTQCIDTGYIVKSANTKVEIVVYSDNYNSKSLYAWNKKSSDSQWMVLYSNVMYIGSGNTGSIGLPSGQKNTLIFETDNNGNYSFSVNDNIHRNGTYNGTFCSDPTPVYIFCQNMGNGFSRQISAKLYYFKLWDNGVLVRDLIPALDKNDVPCMFDRIEGKFYYNAGTGNFIAGPEVE